jgi:hypothetical protein
MSKQKPTKWNWNPRRLKAAELIAVGKMTHEEIAKECSVNRSTVSEWNMHPEFKEKVMDLILLDERATKAGILKRAMDSLEKKTEKVDDDKTTELDYLKFISEFQGHTKQGGDLIINNATAVVMSPEVSEKANELSRILTLNAIEQEEADEQ